jgi:hypothetical protein
MELKTFVFKELMRGAADKVLKTANIPMFSHFLSTNFT